MVFRLQQSTSDLGQGDVGVLGGWRRRRSGGDGGEVVGIKTVVDAGEDAVKRSGLDGSLGFVGDADALERWCWLRIDGRVDTGTRQMTAALGGRRVWC